MSACTTASKHNLPNRSEFFKITLAISDEWFFRGHVEPFSRQHDDRGHQLHHGACMQDLCDVSNGLARSLDSVS